MCGAISSRGTVIIDRSTLGDSFNVLRAVAPFTVNSRTQVTGLRCVTVGRHAAG
jgi:hypothetical protein